jgi:hypothetical protein
MYALNIYAADATIRKDIPEAEIAKLSKEQSDAFFAVMTSYSDTTEADAALIECEKATRRAITDLKRKMDLHEKIVPARTFYDEWKRTIAKLPEPEPDPEITKKLAASIKSVEKTNGLIETCQRNEELGRQARIAKRQAFANALKIWSGLDGTPRTTADLIRARVETERKIAMENIAAGLPADYAVARTSTVGNSHLDRVRAGAAKGGSADRGYNMNRMRGAQLQQPKAQEG